MAKPQYKSMEAIPPLSEIFPGLYQGMRPRTYRGYDLVVSCEEHLAVSPMREYQGMTIHVPMRDDNEFKIPEAEISMAVQAIIFMINRGKNVLVHCTGGLNRSSLVTARALQYLDGFTPSDAVVMLRAKRDPFCLCNKAFERWVLGEKLPTAETSAFRVTSVESLLTEEDYRVMEDDGD